MISAAQASEPWTAQRVKEIYDSDVGGEFTAIANAHNATLQPAHASEPCNLCDRGFPVNASGYHYGTQRLGMIPNTPCKLRDTGDGE